MMTKVLSIAMIQPMAMKTSHMARIAPRIVKIIQPMAPQGIPPWGRAGGGQSPVTPSIRSRMRSAWPLWRVYSSIMCR